ncbi:UDP-glucose 4-epimerase GalE [Blastococcus capsensis]|uniref:UDP-glucose 4-epimerase GalE n=1 Tax=Blastococcus capsensis TaxID=1564163 RepID=UPI002540A29F|nr:UDP-glucose 4-epimerase GalE [Blastococcus capsensis]MDK3256764.1 UDP-glucose 4-epimerase GalE [Blastococcus capsensis]
MRWLVTGGAGYLGAHVVAAMAAAGQDVVVLDDLSTGVPDRVAGHPLVVSSVLDQDAVADALTGAGITGIVHLAAKKTAPESLARPLDYYRQNVEGLRRLLAAAAATGVRAFAFTSSAAVYGTPEASPVGEDAPCRPVNPYGETKVVGEWLVADVARTTGMSFLNLRCFNVAGAASRLLADTHGQDLLQQVADRLDAGVAPLVFGGDHPTPDGSCVRDFVDVRDVADAYVAAAELLASGPAPGLAVNIGRGAGVSVLEMCRLIAAEASSDLAPRVVERRAGDPPAVVADVDRARRLLGWHPRREVREMVRSALAGRAGGRPAPGA